MPAPSAAALRRLAQERTAWLCTLRPDGSPHLTPVWFCYLRGSWWVCSAARNRKVVHLATDLRVSIALPDGDHPLVAEGSARLVRGGFPPDVVTAFAENTGGTSPAPDRRDPWCSSRCP
ncbi:Pyridoxamine 5'-phosphate oxidase [Quadrisphaera granulorum]|uniref:Pyridoxamine 5'-phosphate oxidase n=1 Tax=Quadrisphaera granulorum TaxID=317664 RepID=A0A316A880_9ACTN|nr:pyridoxamine 5'-phosphate oxidase family protein [Quadrisphaera granulorum]PWJ53649.1 pyridoxamine 5'-phosphate oxidase [Quadrisphaera granulorum]SZE96693.1 Pyridoxamine 5'-phosphate oxidase [Quadrisphaera granulorum]